MGAHAERRAGGGLAAVAGLLAVATLIGMFVFRPTGHRRPDINQFGAIKDTYDGRIESAPVADCGPGDQNSGLLCQTVTFRILEGPDEGATFTQQFPLSPGTPRLTVGEKVLVGHQENGPQGFEYVFVDRFRKAPLFWLAAMFTLAVLLLGRLRGAAALAGLVASFVVLLTFVVPAILDGRSPVTVSLIGASAIAYLALYLAHGFNRRTTVALLGTLGGLGVTATLAAVFHGITYITGLASEEARFLLAVGADVNFAGLILGGVIIGALGAIDDITVTQASAIWELKAANPDIQRRRLFGAGMRIGRDHVSSTVNTLALAYVGASMPVLLLFVLSNQSLGTVANGEIVATEIFRGLVGSIGLIASVPITTLLAARFVAVPTATERGRALMDEDGAGDALAEDSSEIFIPERRRDTIGARRRGWPARRSRPSN